MLTLAFLGQPANPAAAPTQVAPAGLPGPPGSPGPPGPAGPSGVSGASTVSQLTDATSPFKALNVADAATQRQAMGAAAASDLVGVGQDTLTALKGKVDRTRTTVSDAAYTILASDVYVAMTALTVARTFTLPAASAFPVGQPLYIADESGACSAINLITVAAAGTDTIAGQPTMTMGAPYQRIALHSNGSNLWIV